MTNIGDTKIIGHFKHVIRLQYPCGNIEDIRGPHGEPPTAQQFAMVLKRHRDECDSCG